MILNELSDFINRNYIEVIINDSSYNHIDMITYLIILFAGVYATLKLLNKLGMKVDEAFVVATIPYVFMGSVFRVIEDANLFAPPIKYFFITPLIFFVVFVISFWMLLLAGYLEKTRKIKNYIHVYAYAGILFSFAGIVILFFNSYKDLRPDVLVYSIVPAVALTGIVQKLSHAMDMTYLRSRGYSFVIFSFLLDSLTTFVGVDLLGYANKHPFSSFLTSIFGSGIVLTPLSLMLVLLIILMLEKESWKSEDEKYMLILTLNVLGLSMGARNLLAMFFGV